MNNPEPKNNPMPSNWLEAQKEIFLNLKPKPISKPTVEEFNRADSEGCLFHGTNSRASIRAIKPKFSRHSEDKVVFAGFPWVALAFTANWTDRTVSMGTIDGNPYLDIHSKEVYKQYQKGGFVYQVSPETFFHTERLTRFEFVSTEVIKPIGSVFVPNPLDLLIELGVSVTIPKKE